MGLQIHCGRNLGGIFWSYETGGDVFSSSAVAERLVYVGSFDGKTYALDAGTGDMVWSYQTGDGSDEVRSSPAVADGFVDFGSWDSVVCALGLNNTSPAVSFAHVGLSST